MAVKAKCPECGREAVVEDGQEQFLCSDDSGCAYVCKLEDIEPWCLSNSELLDEIKENVEVIMSCGPSAQFDAKEERAKLSITGPSRLISLLADRLCE